MVGSRLEVLRMFFARQKLSNIVQKERILESLTNLEYFRNGAKKYEKKVAISKCFVLFFLEVFLTSRPVSLPSSSIFPGLILNPNDLKRYSTPSTTMKWCRMQSAPRMYLFKSFGFKIKPWNDLCFCDKILCFFLSQKLWSILENELCFWNVGFCEAKQMLFFRFDKTFLMLLHKKKRNRKKVAGSFFQKNYC